MQYTAMRLSPEDRAYLDERYGLNNRKRWPGYVVAVIVVGFVAWIAWAYWAEIHPKVSSGETSYSLNTTHNASGWRSTVTYQVVRSNKNVQVTCSAQALASTQAVVGTSSFNPFAHSSATTGTFTSTITSYLQAYAINWVGCTAPGQNSPK